MYADLAENWLKCRRLLAFALIAVLATAVYGQAAQTGPKRIALVIGNDLYQHLPKDQQLQNAINDAKLMRDTLKSLNFHVIYGENLDREAFEDAVFDFTGRISKGDTAFFFYAGHGVGIRGGNYLLPSDIKPPQSNREQEEQRIIRKSIAEYEIVSFIQRAGASVVIAAIDACRDNPLAAGGSRSVGGTRGLQMKTPPEGVFTIYSAGLNQKALDRLPSETESVNSVFTRVFAKAIVKRGKTLEEVAESTKAEVRSLAKSEGFNQNPAVYDQIFGTPVYLAGLPVTEEKPAAQSENQNGSQTGPVSLGQRPHASAFELAYWESVKNSRDPEVFTNYLTRYPDGEFVDLARATLRSLEREREAAEKQAQRKQEERSFWESVKDSGDPNNFREYVRRFPNGDFVDLARARVASLEELASANRRVEEEFWSAVKDSGSATLLEGYLERYPNGRFAGIAKVKITILTAASFNGDRDAEERGWLLVRNTTDVSALMGYLEEFPNGLYSNVAREKIELITSRERAKEEAASTLRLQQQEDAQRAHERAEEERLVALRRSDPCRNYELDNVSSNEQALIQIRLYYEDLDTRNVDCAVNRRTSSDSRLRRAIAEFGFATVEDVRVVSGSNSRLTVAGTARVGKRNGPEEVWDMRFSMVRRAGVWKISKTKGRRVR